MTMAERIKIERLLNAIERYSLAGTVSRCQGFGEVLVYA
jgi:hypothetical protein